MGFFDSFNKAVQEGQAKAEEKRANSNYKTVKERTYQHQHRFDGLSNMDLLNKYNSIFISAEDKEDIAKILCSRGYIKAPNGTLHR